VDLKL